MRSSAAILVLTCLVIATGADRGLAQQYVYPPGAGGVLVSPGMAQYVEGYSGYESGYACGCGAPRVWGEAEYVLGFQKARRLPYLVTTSPPDTLQEEAGVLGLTSTSVLYGAESIEDNPQSGVRGEIGVWLDCEARLGIGGVFMTMEEDSSSYRASSDGTTILARPFYNTLLGEEASQLVAFPELVSGVVNVRSGNEVTSAEVFLRKQIGLWPTSAPFLLVTDAVAARVRSLFTPPGTQVVNIQEYATQPGTPMTRVDFIIGGQFTRIDDSLVITNNLVSLDPSYLGQVGTTLDAFDLFDVRNDFYGGTLGLRSVSYYRNWSLTMLGKVALGSVRQSVSIDGQTVITLPDGPSATTEGGLLTQLSNMGTYDRNRFAVVPEARIMLCYNFTPRLSLGVGYEFMYWDSVALAGGQVDRLVDVTQTLADPGFSFEEDNFFVHGVTFLLQLNH
jgi:hypothetical protein